MIVTMIGFGQEIGCTSGDCENGKGTYIWENGDRYSGAFKDGERNGKGTYTDQHGNFYIGEWKDNKYHGQGIWQSADNDFRYKGEYKDGKRDGQGTFTFRDEGNGKFVGYVGEWKNDQEHGIGMYVNKEGNYDKAYYENGETRFRICFNKKGKEIDCAGGGFVPEPDSISLPVGPYPFRKSN